MRLNLRHLALGLALATSGCQGSSPRTFDPVDVQHSLVRVDLSFTRADHDAPRFDGEAHFIRYRALDPARVPRLLGLTLDRDGQALDACRASDGTAELDAALAGDAQPAEVILLDAGRLDVHGPQSASVLKPHPYPEVLPFVSGVIYAYAGDEENAPLDAMPGETYVLEAEGGLEVGPFTAAVSAPRDFADVEIAAYQPGQDLALTWTPDDASAALDLELKWASPTGTAQTLRCRAADDGVFAVPAALLADLANSAEGATLSVAVSRHHRASFDAPGVGYGELSIELRSLAIKTLP